MFRLLTLLWIPVIAIKIVLVAAGLIIVPIGLRRDRLPPLYRGSPATFWNLAIRNPISGFGWYFDQPDGFSVKTNFGSDLESRPLRDAGQKSAYRWRWAGWKVSYRYLRLLKGGDRYLEVYFGWKLGSQPVELDFATQLRIGDVGN